MKLETERIILRSFTLDDLEAFTALVADSEVMRFSPKGPLKDKIQAKELFQKESSITMISMDMAFVQLFSKKDHGFMGWIGLMTQNIDEKNQIELGYRLYSQYWGKGLATEACLAVCHYANAQLGISEIISIIDPKNIRSLNVAKRIGMTYLKETFFHHIPVQIYKLKCASKNSKYNQE